MTAEHILIADQHAAVFGVAGWSGSGKTTLVEQIVSHFVEIGVDVATVKHALEETNEDLNEAFYNCYDARLGLARERAFCTCSTPATSQDIFDAPVDEVRCHVAFVEDDVTLTFFQEFSWERD